MQALCTDEQFNIGCGVGTSIRELVDLLLALTGSSLRPEYGAGGQTFVTHRLGSTEKATALLGFTARTSLREGLQQVIDWRQRLAAGVR
jgi:UDP-glucose 4-epimerase